MGKKRERSTSPKPRKARRARSSAGSGSLDLARILRDWTYESGQINVRLIEGDDGLPKIQMRLDLGLLQMEVSGRPDGQRPGDYESLLESYESLLDEAHTERAHRESNDQEGPSPGDQGAEERADEGAAAGGGEGGPGGLEGADEEPADFTLSPDDCRMLREEAVQYYHRYVALLVLQEYDAVVRDTSRNLRVLDLCKEFAETEEDRAVLEQFRPYITMMRGRALASQALVDGEPKAALFCLDEALQAIRDHYRANNAESEFDAASEVQLLRGMRDELVLKLPVSQKAELRQRLQQAIEQENYELAAILRDELKMLKE